MHMATLLLFGQSFQASRRSPPWHVSAATHMMLSLVQAAEPKRVPWTTYGQGAHCHTSIMQRLLPGETALASDAKKRERSFLLVCGL